MTPAIQIEHLGVARGGRDMIHDLSAPQRFSAEPRRRPHNVRGFSPMRSREVTGTVPAVIGVGSGEHAELLRSFGAEPVVASLGSLLDRRLAA